MASPSERMAELRAALRELEYRVAKLRTKEAARRSASAQSDGAHVGRAPDNAAASAAANGRFAERILRPPFRAVVDWLRFGNKKPPAAISAPRR